MKSNLRLGKVFGIDIEANWSLAIIFALIGWTLAAAELPAMSPGQPVAAYWLAGLAGSLLFYGGLLAHELSHALVARRQGLRVQGITLWLFGGVSRLEGEPRSAGAEALIAAVGPLTSWAVAAACFALELAAGGTLVGALFAWLAVLNVALGVFNLLPAFPLDGGRLLGSFFWWRTGSRLQGVRRAVAVGRVVAYLLIALGVWELLSGAALDGIWIAFVAWFLLSAASAEAAGLETRALLGDLPVSAAMSTPVITVPGWLTLDDFLTSRAAGYRFTTYPLHDEMGSVTGVVRLPDLQRLRPADRTRVRLRDLARPLGGVATATPQQTVVQLLDRSGSALAGRALVFEGDRLVGIVSPADIARLLTLRGLQPGPAPVGQAG